MHPAVNSIRSVAVLNKALSKNLMPSLRSPSRAFPMAKRHFHHAKEKNVIASHFEDVPIPNMLLNDYVWQHMDRWEDKTAVVCGITGRGFTYRQAYQMSRAFGACLRSKLKIQDGDVLAIMLPNLPEFALVSIGAMHAGCIVTSVNPIYTEDEIHRQLEDSNAKIIVIVSSALNVVQKAIEKTNRDIKIIVCTENNEAAPSGTIKFAEFAENFQIDTDCLKEVRRKPEDVVFMPYSSGTTGLPKGVELTHRNIVANIQQIHAGKIRVFHETTANYQDSVPCVLPFFHIYGFSTILMSKLSVGCKQVTLSKFTPDTFLAAQERHKGTILHLVPPIVLFMASHPAVSRQHLESVHTVLSGAAPLAGSDVERFMKRCEKKVAFMQGYGLTESSPVCLMQERGSPNYAAVGSPIPLTDAKIVSLDEIPTDLGPNQEGELWVRGPQVMKGYHNNQKGNDEIFAPDGWLKTGDLCYYDEDHSFYITDRLKELIKVKGYQVAPAELEGILRNHPSLSDAAVIGIPDQKSGEVPKAFVVLKNDKATTEKDIMDYLAQQVAPFKNLGAVQFVKDIPKNAAGKILRRELKKLYL